MRGSLVWRDHRIWAYIPNHRLKVEEIWDLWMNHIGMPPIINWLISSGIAVGAALLAPIL